MAQQMNETQRLQALETFNPAEHLTDIKSKDGTMKKYLPAAWRFYLLNLCYPNANFSSELIYYDIEKNFCVVRCRLFLGPDYELSAKKAESMKQGLFTSLDKVETAAKARCCRDFGIGTEYALEFNEEDEMPAPTTGEALATIKEQVKSLSLARNPQQWASWKKTILGRDLADGKLTAGHVAKLTAAIEQAKSNEAA